MEYDFTGTERVGRNSIGSVVNITRIVGVQRLRSVTFRRTQYSDCISMHMTWVSFVLVVWTRSLCHLLD